MIFKNKTAQHIFKTGANILNKAPGVFEKSSGVVKRGASTIGKISNVLAKNPDIVGTDFGKQTIQGLQTASKFGGVLSKGLSQAGELSQQKNIPNAIEKAKALKSTGEDLIKFA